MQPDFLVMKPCEQTIEQAKQMIVEADKRFTNFYQHDRADFRFVGFLGEIAFDSWVRSHGIDSQWIRENPAGKPDFILQKRLKVEVKTSRRGYLPNSPKCRDDMVVIAERHIKTAADWFMFQAYTENPPRLWLLGAVSVPEFREIAKLNQKGDKVNEGFIAPWPMWGFPLLRLLPPSDWIDKIGLSEI